MNPLFLSLGPALAAAIIRTDRRIVADLRAAGATTEARAIALGGWRLRRLRTRRLTSTGALGAAPDGRSWLREDGWRAYRAARRVRVLTAAAIALTLALAGLWLAGRYA